MQVSQSSVLGSILFLIFINDFLDVIRYRLGIYIDDTIVYSCIHGKSDRFDKVKLVTELC